MGQWWSKDWRNYSNYIHKNCCIWKYNYSILYIMCWIVMYVKFTYQEVRNMLYRKNKQTNNQQICTNIHSNQQFTSQTVSYIAYKQNKNWIIAYIAYKQNKNGIKQPITYIATIYISNYIQKKCIKCIYIHCPEFSNVNKE